MGATPISFGAIDLANAELALAQAPERLARELVAAMDKTVDGLVVEAQNRTPNAFGKLRQSMLGVTHMTGMLAVEGVVGSPFPHAEWVELGTKPHPVSTDGRLAIADWAQQKLGVSEKEAKGAAFLVARKIRAKGTKGAFMLRDSLAASAPRIHANFSGALQRAVAGIGK